MTIVINLPLVNFLLSNLNKLIIILIIIIIIGRGIRTKVSWSGKYYS